MLQKKYNYAKKTDNITMLLGCTALISFISAQALVASKDESKKEYKQFSE